MYSKRYSKNIRDRSKKSRSRKYNYLIIIIYNYSCNGRTFVTEPEWTCIHPGLKQKFIIDYIITDMQMLKKSGKLCVDKQTLEFPIIFCFGWD